MMIASWIVLYLFMAGYMLYLLHLDEKEILKEYDRARRSPLVLLFLATIWPATCILYLITYLYDRIFDAD